ncbi:MAG: rhomboid family intramembrane serine protease [Eubacterium sp.]|nr:rhomboid family intramembrane serine protease [Eubacterium sp.]
MDDYRQEPVEGSEKDTKLAAASILLVIINTAVWCILELRGDTRSGAYIARYGGMYPEALLYGGEWHRLFTSMFLHFGAEHLANNMILLAAAGSRLERETGPFRYLAIYLGAGLAGNLLSFYMMMQTGDYAVCAGASGGVFGIIGALIWAAIRNKGKFQGLTLKGLVLMTALCMYYGITSAGVDNWAHAGGAAGGFFLCVLLYRKTHNA